MPGPAFTTGDRVSLHPIEEEDHEFVQYGRQHPSTRKPLTETTIRSLSDVEDVFEDAEYHFLICSQTSDDDPERVGVVAFTYTRGTTSGSLMYWIAPEHRGEGYVTEALELFLDYAFREVGFHKVFARTIVTNDASIATLESLGFEREGQFREERFTDGEWVGAYQYAVLADEWLG